MIGKKVLQKLKMFFNLKSLGIIFPFVFLNFAQAGDPFDSQFRDFLAKSPLREKTPPTKVYGKKYDYSPLAFSVSAALKSREPKSASKGFVEVLLPYGKGEASIQNLTSPCPKDFSAHWKPSPKGNASVFVVIPGGFFDWEKANSVRQILDILQTKFPASAVLVLPGFLHPKFLKETCNLLALPTDAWSLDLRERLRIFLTQQAHATQVSSVGFSSGASVLIHLLGWDAKLPAPIFTGKNAALSPLIDLEGSSFLLDSEFQSGVDKEITLESKDWVNVRRFASLSSLLDGMPNWSIIPEKFKDEEGELKTRFYNQFIAKHLTEALEALKKSKRIPETVVQSHSLRFTLDFHLSFANELFAKASQDPFSLWTNSTRAQLAKVSSPLWIQLSHDDPLLDEKSKSLNPILNAALGNPQILLNRTNFGGHAGAFLDESFPSQIESYLQDWPLPR